jgi:hypothetical protein
LWLVLHKLICTANFVHSVYLLLSCFLCVSNITNSRNLWAKLNISRPYINYTLYNYQSQVNDSKEYLNLLNFICSCCKLLIILFCSECSYCSAIFRVLDFKKEERGISAFSFLFFVCHPSSKIGVQSEHYEQYL